MTTLGNSEFAPTATNQDEPAEFARRVLEAMEYERQGRMEGSDNSSHEAGIADYKKSSRVVAQLLRQA